MKGLKDCTALHYAVRWLVAINLHEGSDAGEVRLFVLEIARTNYSENENVIFQGTKRNILPGEVNVSCSPCCIFQHKTH
jgi:hypothetical protein